MKRRWAAWRCVGLWVWALAACGGTSPLPDMEPGETGRVVRVIDGDALVLNTGQVVRLVGIEAPVLKPRGREPDPHSREAARTLEDLVLGREVQVYYPGLTRDRYDRALGHLVAVDQAGPPLWVNMELIRRGAARVRLYPDTAAMGEALLIAEAVARRDETGLWGKAAYRVRQASQLEEGQRGFELVTATLAGDLPIPVGIPVELACVRAVEGGALRVEVRVEAAEVCALPEGARLRLRGWVTEGRLDLTHPLHAEELD
ncbi:MAG: thermonuclease family protein [Henriciella sp.]|nr:thermonuclease family protein [Henriciella sp.]